MSEINSLYQIYLRYPLISTDTRAIEKDSMFFALKGENFNGNDFAMKALEAGAAYAIVDEEVGGSNERVVLVDDVLKTLQQLGRFHRDHFKKPVIGITGSNGKTTTKELINAVLSTQYNVHATSGNFNNHIGVPLTLLRQKVEHEVMIVEMGANGLNEIADLCLISDPDIGLITNIGKAHLGGFGSYEGIKQTKLGLYRHITSKDGLLFVNADDKVLMEASEGCRRITYGKSGQGLEASYRINEMGCVNIILDIDGEKYEMISHLFGSFNFYNILAAITLGLHFDVSLENMQIALDKYKPSNNRSQVADTGRNKVVMDAYNANPSSMVLAIDSFMEFPGEKKLLILGDMLELGHESRKEHLAVADKLGSIKGIDVLLVGKEFQSLKSQFPSFTNTDEVMAYLNDKSLSGYSILLKGSRGIGLEKCLPALS